MPGDGAGALLGGLLIGGLVVGAAMSADNAAQRQNRRNYARYNRHHRKRPTFCICGAHMIEGKIQQGICKCSNLNCQKLLTGSVCYYCPNGGNVQQHKNGFFYCHQCAFQSKNGTKVIQQPPQPQPQQQPLYNAYPAQPKVVKKKGAYIIKQGYMNKKGNWFNTGYKKRWFKLWSNKKMAYMTHPGASYTKGYCDFAKIQKMEKKGKHGMEVTTSERVWSFLCQSENDRNEWFNCLQVNCMGIQPKVQYVQQQPKVQYVQQAQPQYAQPNVQYAQAQPNNANAYPQLQQPQQQQQQPMYRGSVIQQPSPNQMQPNVTTRPQSQSLQPGMMGYNVGNMYGDNMNMNEEKKENENENVNVNVKQWEDVAPPPAFASAPPQDEVMPSAPPQEQEGAYTGQ